MADFVAKQGDSAPTWSDTLTYSDGSPVSLAGATVAFVMRAAAASVAFTLTGTVTVTDAAAGELQYQPTSADTATAGEYLANWVVTFSGGQVMTFPTVGYLWVSIEESLTQPSQQLISVALAKDLLNVQATDRSHDMKIQRFVNAYRPLFERITGPIIPQQFEEWHDGGQIQITLRRRPSTALGTSPLLILNAVSEYNGPIEWPLTIISSPDKGQLYSVQLDANLGQIVRRTAGGGVQPFATSQNMPQSVHVWYTTGQQQVPDNVTEAMGLLLQLRYQKTQQGGPASWGGRSDDEDGPVGPPIGFALPGVVRELLSPNRRFPAFA